MAKQVVDYITEEDYPRYQELLEMATAAKAAAPKAPRTRAPMTAEAKIKAQQSRLDKAKAALDALLATQK